MLIKDKNYKKYNFHKEIIENLIRLELNINYLNKKTSKERCFLDKYKKLIDKSILFKIIKKNKLVPFFNNNQFIKKHLEDLYISIKNEAKIEFYKSLRLSLLTSEVSNFLRKNNIDHLIIKGVVLSHNIYNDVSKRGGGDLDILINKKELFKIINLLKKLDFYVKENTFPLFADKLEFSYSKWVYYEITLIRKKENFFDFIDLHWRMDFNTAGIPSFQDAISNKESFFLNNVSIPVPNYENNLILITSNGSKDRWNCYRNLIDLNLLINLNNYVYKDDLIKRKFFNMTIYRTFKLTNDKNINHQKRYILNEFIVNFIDNNYQLSIKKSARKNKLSHRFIIFLYKIYLCENANDILSNISINLLTPESIINKRNGKINNFIFILHSRINSLRNLFK